MRTTSLALLVSTLFVLPIACNKDEKKTDKSENAEKSSDKDKDKDEGTVGKKAKKDGDKSDKGDKGDKADDDKPEKKAKGDVAGFDVKGVGGIPDWSPPRSRGKCDKTPKPSKGLNPLYKGEDDDVTNGKADVEQLVKDNGGECARAQVAAALNSGGFMFYKKKEWQKAERWWRAALQTHPQLAIARYNLACTLALDGKNDAALHEMGELAKAAKDGDPAASNFLEKAKSDDDLKSVKDDPDFKNAVAASQGGLVGPRKEPETAAAAAKLLPEDYRKVKDTMGVTEAGFVTYKPAFLEFWTWRPDGKTELLVGTVIDDPSRQGKPLGDMNLNYGAIAVLQREGSGYKLLFQKKTGENPPSVAGGKGGTVNYGFYYPCGDLRGTLTYKGGKVETKEQTCEEMN